MKRILKRGLHFLQKRNTFRYALSVAVALLVIASAVSASGLGRHVHAAATLAPETIGLGQGTAACASSAGPYCSAAYQISMTVSWDECGHGGDSSFTIYANDPNGRLATLGGQPCSGSATLVFWSPAGVYGVWIYGEQTGGYYEVIPGNPYNEAFAFNGPGNNCVPVTGVCSGSVNTCAAGDLGATATYPNNPATGQTTYQWWCNGSLGGSNTLCSVTAGVATPYGAINSILPNPCYIAAGQTACQPTVGWNTGNTNGAVAINIINALGWSPYGTETGYSGYIATAGSSAWTPLPVGRYTLKLYGQDSTSAWNILDQKNVDVPPAPPSSISAICNAAGTQLTIKWPTSAGADLYQIQYPINATTPCSATSWTLWTGDNTTCYLDPSPAVACTASDCTVTMDTTPGMSSKMQVEAGNSVIGWNWTSPTPASFSCAVPGVPDLTAGPTSPNTAVAGASKVYTATITNKGTAATGAAGTTFKTLFQIANAADCSGSPLICSPATDIAAAKAPSLAKKSSSLVAAVASPALGSGGATEAVTDTYTFPSAGSYYMRACADKINSGTFDAVPDSNPGNNCGAWSPVTVSAAAPTCSPSCTAAQSCVATNTCACTNGLDITTYPSCACPAGQTQSGSSCVPTGPTCSPSCLTGQTCVATNTCGCTNGLDIRTYPSCTCPASQIQSGSSCISATPAPPTIMSFTVSPNRVRSGGSTTISWQCSADATTIAITGQNGFRFSNAGTSGSVDSGSHNGDPKGITAQTNFTLTCANAGGAKSSTQTVFLIPSEIEQ